MPAVSTVRPGGLHIYTTSATERDGLALCPGWTYGGPAGYVYAQPTTGAAELLRLWKPDPIPEYVPWVQGDQTWSLYLVINNSPYPLLVSGTRGSDLHDVTLGRVVPPFGGSLEVARMHWGIGDRHDWVYLSDLASPQRYQIYADNTAGGSYHASFGYFDSQSSQSHSDPSPFPIGTATAQWGSKGYWIFTLNTTPELQQTDLQAVTDQLGYILAGEALEWTASTTYDLKSNPELAPYIAQASASRASKRADVRAK
ncbi:MAG TPA: hypothetical protein VIT91_12115 [Chthoniobacterales bacterium]